MMTKVDIFCQVKKWESSRILHSKMKILFFQKSKASNYSMISNFRKKYYFWKDLHPVVDKVVKSYLKTFSQ